MHKKFLLLAAWVIIAPAYAFTIDESTVDFGERYQFDEILRDVRVWNDSLVPIRLSANAPLGGQPPLTFDESQLAPGQSTAIHIRLPLGNHNGRLTARFPFNSEAAGKLEGHEIVVSGFVNSVLDDPRPAVDLGVVDVKAPSGKSFSISSIDEPEVQISRLLEVPDFLSARIDGGQTLYIAPSKLDVLGYSKGVLKVALTSKRQAQAWITVLMDVHGDVQPDQNPLDFGLQRQSNRRPIRLQLHSRNDKAFRVGEVKVDARSVGVEPTHCLQPSESCRAYLLTIDSSHGFGEITGKIGFVLPETHQILNVHLGGMYLADNTRVVPLDEPESKNSPSKSNARPEFDLAESLKRSTSERKELVLPGTGPLLKWQVANEAGIYGYAIYRGDSADGKFTRVNEQIVKAENGGDNTTANYQWRDTTAQKGREYWYYITIFNNNGKKTQLTGPQKVVAK